MSGRIPRIGKTLPAEYASVDLTAQTAAIGATTLYAVPSSGAGMYRISFVAKITTAGAVSSTLGGAGGFQVIYTDPDSVAVTTGAITNTAGTTLTSNTTQILYAGSVYVNCKASTNLQYQFGYTDGGGGTAMAYNIHVRVELL